MTLATEHGSQTVRQTPAETGRGETDRPWMQWISTTAGVCVALLPRAVCPCQFPAYAGLAGGVGLTVLARNLYAFPLTAFFLTMAVGGIALRAGQRRGYGPLLAALAAAALLMIGRFVLAWPLATHAGVLLLLASSVWNAWPSSRKFAWDASGNLVPVRKHAPERARRRTNQGSE